MYTNKVIKVDDIIQLLLTLSTKWIKVVKKFYTVKSDVKKVYQLLSIIIYWPIKVDNIIQLLSTL